MGGLTRVKKKKIDLKLGLLPGLEHRRLIPAKIRNYFSRKSSFFFCLLACLFFFCLLVGWFVFGPVYIRDGTTTLKLIRFFQKSLIENLVKNAFNFRSGRGCVYI